MLLSVIIPTHNRMNLLEKCMAALELQTWKEFEVVVTVDGSTDGTLALLEAVNHRQPFPLTVLSHSQAGRSAARNAAMKAATGEILLLCDDDLQLEPETLARHHAFHEVFKNAVALAAVRFPDGVTRFPTRPGWMNFSGCNASLPRLAALEVGLFDESLGGYGGEDLEFGLRLEQYGLKFKALADAGAYHDGTRVPNPEKAYSAGRQAVQIAHKYGTAVALQLGVHETLLTAKRAVLNPIGDAILGKDPNYAFERAYLKGARDGWKEFENTNTP
jgi:glycosyltransferase involved in cell wall biosynthesis